MYMKYIEIKDWHPSDGLNLETNALHVVKSSENTLVIAGPGAGKTEMLAQRANFLLQTNTCVYPRKILAISFKKDASLNLHERVMKRSGEKLARRFESLTFDSFAKQILDRFKQGLPESLLISDNYEILTTDQNKIILNYYKSIDIDFYNSTMESDILKLHFQKLPLLETDKYQKTRKKAWEKMLTESPSKLTFPMVMRLAEFIININPKIKKYLQETYAYVFLDEFQDTTEIQYSFFKSCFLNSNAIYTAVGDDKQRIMRWAGAQETIFEDFKQDTRAKEIHLFMNFRSAPRLVELQNYLTNHLLKKDSIASPSSRWNKEDGICELWLLANPDQEQENLLKDIKKWIYEENINPRDICILVKGRLELYTGELIKYLNKNGVNARNEDKFQNFLTEEFIVFIINFLRACSEKIKTESRYLVFNFLSNLYDESDTNKLLLFEFSISQLINKTKTKYDFDNLEDRNTLKNIIDEIIFFTDIDKLRAKFPNYRNTHFFSKLIQSFIDELWNCYQNKKEFFESIDSFLGVNTVPIMTIHKSKGLEYHSVIFIGLEDGAFWSYKKQMDEDNCAFFVALSRAKERIIFTISRKRMTNYGLKPQSVKSIEEIINVLNTSCLVDIIDKSEEN